MGDSYHERRFDWLRALPVAQLIAVFREEPSIRYQSRWIRKRARPRTRLPG